MTTAHGIHAVGAALVALTLAAAPASAHEFWISPEAGVVAPGAEIVADLKVGTMLRGSSYPYLSNRFQSFVAGEAKQIARGEDRARAAGRALRRAMKKLQGD